MSTPLQLSALSDPAALAKLQILLVPVQQPDSSLPQATYEFWTSLIKRHSVLRGDELVRPNPQSHQRGGVNPRSRFLPASSSTSISKGGAPNHVHIAYPSHPPARHLSSLSLLRLSAFPLVVIGITTDSGASPVKGYDVNGDDEDGDIGSSSTPTKASFSHNRNLSTAFEDTVGGLFPPTSPFPLVKKLVVVPQDAPVSPSAYGTPKRSGSSIPASAARGKGREDERDVVHAPVSGLEGWIGRLLGEVVSDALGELGELATALETPQGLKTLASTLLPSLTSTLPHASERILPGLPTSSTPTNDLSRRRSSTPSISIPHSQSLDSLGISLTRALTPGGRPTSVGPPSAPPIQSSAIAPSPAPVPVPASSNPFRRSTAIASPFSRSTSSASLASTASVNSATQQLSNGTKYTAAPLGGLAGGRLLKLLGDMYLLAGMYADAIRCFEDGAERCRTVGDVLWEGSAREGRAVAGIGEAWEGRDGSNMSQPFPSSPIPVEILSHYLSALACLSRAPLPYPPTILSPSPQAVSGTLSFAAPSTMNPSAIGTGEGLLAYLYASLSLRISHFLLIMWSASGWGSIALSSLLSHCLPRNFPLPPSADDLVDSVLRRKRRRNISVLSSKSGMTRSSIFGHAEAALGPHSRAMTKSEQLALHVEAVWLSRYLDLPRKEACISREVVKKVGIMVAEGREETRRLGSAGYRSKPPEMPVSDGASVGLGLGIAVQTPSSAIGIRRRESTEGNLGVMTLFERALAIMGIDLLELAEDPAKRVTLNQGAEVPPLRFGWPELQVEMMKEGIAVAEALPDHLSIVRLCTSALHRLHTHLNGHSQSHVAKMLPAALATIRRRGMEFGAMPWWIPGKMVLSMELASLPPNRLPIEHSSAEIVLQNGKRDPFLYNPRLKVAEAGKTVLVAGEQTDVFVTLQNPFAFDLDIQNVSLVTAGVPFTTNPLPVHLPPSSVQTVRVTGLPSASGSLQLKGIDLRLADGSHTEILLPLLSEAHRSKQDKHHSRRLADRAKTKRHGVEARYPVTEISRDSEQVEEKWLECKVVEEQPLVWIKKTNLTHGTVMLYDGETSTIRITLENSSKTPVDFIKLSFDDSASRAAQALLAEGELSPEQAYELEYDVVKRPVFTYESDVETAIAPGGRTTIVVSCLGKVGCTDGLIRIDYGYLHASPDAPPTIFQTRHITFPVLFTVYHTLEPHSLDIIRLDTDASEKHGNAEQPNGYLSVSHDPSRRGSGSRTPVSPGFPTMGDALASDKLRQEMDDEHCLVCVNVRNVYGVPFEVTIAREGESAGIEADGLSTTKLVPPGATERLLLPLPRLSLPPSDLAAAIPSLSERQYVVNKVKKTPEQHQADMELFWYREAFLQSLSATWIEPGSRRSGIMSLRTQILTPPLLDVLKVNDLELTLEAVAREGKEVRPTEFVDIVLKVTNRLDRPVKPLVRIEPLPSSNFDHSSWASSAPPTRRPQSTNPGIPVRNVVFDGALSSTLPALPPGETTKYRIGAVFLATGEFSFRAAVQEVSEVQQPTEALPKIHFSPLLSVSVQQ